MTLVIQSRRGKNYIQTCQSTFF